MDSCGIVVAAGKGSRLGFPKQYIQLAGKPMWERSVRALADGGVAVVWLVVPAADVPAVTDFINGLDELSRPPIREVVAGGASRAESVKLGLQAVLQSYTRLDQVVVAIHDAARPFVSPLDVAGVLAAARVHGGAMLGEPCVDTMKKVQNDEVIETISREGLWRAQTPQAFRGDWLQDAYRRFRASEVTDDASLMELAGYPVHILPATGFNGKVTTGPDLEFATWLATQKWGGSV